MWNWFRRIKLGLLRDSIRRSGIIVPVIVDEEGNILDGRHRVEIARELGILVPVYVLKGEHKAGIDPNALNLQTAVRIDFTYE